MKRGFLRPVHVFSSVCCLVAFTSSSTYGQDFSIDEFLAVNARGLTDSDGTHVDWIEIVHHGQTTASLSRWYLTDNAGSLMKWRFPDQESLVLEPGERLVVFASGKNRTGDELHTNFSLSGNGEFLALVRPDGVNVAHAYTSYPGQRADTSFGGGSTSDSGPQFFRTPTPGAPNGPGFYGFVADTTFSVDRGFFETPFEVEIASETAGATIHYTTDGTAPSATHGIRYTVPIRVETTTILRAVAMKANLGPTDVDTQTYIFLDDVIRQSRPAGYPTSWAGLPADYDMDPEVTSDSASPDYEPTIRDDLKSIPTLSIVMDPEDLFDPDHGIYVNPLRRGRDWERGGSVELFTANGSLPEIQINCGVRIQGGSSARPIEGKHSFRLLFTSRHGPPSLSYPLFRDSTVEEFNTIVLRCFATDSWHFKDGADRYRRWDSQYIRDVFMRDSQLDMGHLSGHNTYVHLYLNGLYWGLYNPAERPDDAFHAAYLDGKAEDWDVVKDFTELFRGSLRAWSQMINLANGGFEDQASYQRLRGNNPDGTRNPEYPVLLDVQNLIDYMILHFYAGAEDWPSHNWYAARKRVGATPGFQFFAWDQGNVLDFSFRNRLDVRVGGTPAFLYARLRGNRDFRVLFSDRVHRHFFNGGALTDGSAQRRWMKRADEIDRAIVGESARWGDFREDVPDPTNTFAELYTRNRHWVVERKNILDEYIPTSRRLAMARFQTEGFYPEIAAPTFNRQGGNIAPGFALTIASASGTIFYTLDGTDPRLPGGAVSPTTRLLKSGGNSDEAVTLTRTTAVKSRVRSGNNWSALNEAVFTVDSGLRVTELMYHPAPDADSRFDQDEFEFVELQNTGAEPIDLTGVRFTGGIEFDFSESDIAILKPREIVVVVENLAAMASRYNLRGVRIAGQYSGKLDNSGEKVELLGSLGESIQRFTFSDSWYPATDGGGPSLAIVDETAGRALWNSAAGWRESNFDFGSPGIEERRHEGFQRPGDTDQDGKLALTDSLRLLSALFVDPSLSFPCGRTLEAGGNQTLLDANGDLRVNLSDAVHVLRYLYTGGTPHRLGSDCRPIDGCPTGCR